MNKTFIKIVALLFVLLMLFSGCSASREKINTEQNSQSYVEGEDFQNYLDPMSAVAKADNGYYYFNDLKLYYFDIETKESYPVCNKPNCDHSSASCMAFFNMFQFYPFQLSYYKNALYVWGWEEDGNVRHNYIYSVSLDDYKREKAAFLYDGTNTGSYYFIVHRGYIYYVKNGGTDLKEQTAYLYRVKIGDKSRKREDKPIYEFSGIGATVWNVTASGNNIIFSNSSYGDSKGNDYKNSYSIINIHSLESSELVEDGNYSIFANGNYVYYGKDENTINRIDLITKEETSFCDINGPCYISADDNYIYFDNLQSIIVGNTDEQDRKIFVYDKTGKYITEIVPKNPKDDCYFGGDDIMIFKEIKTGEVVETDEANGYYIFDKSQLTSPDKQFIDLE